MRHKAQIIRGAGAKLMINGRTVGEATSFNWSSETPKREIRGIDSPVAYELAPAVARVRGNVTVYRLSRRGGIEGRGLVASSFKDMPREKYHTITLIDLMTDLPLFECTDAVITAQQWNVVAKGLMLGSFSFEGLQWHNEVE